MGTHNDLTPIKSRIVGFDTKPADQFNAHPHNWRKHPQRQREAVAASLRELGWIAPVIENRQTGNLIDGHERVWQALQRGEDVPYMVVDLSPEEEALALATFDAITSMAETDAEALDRLLAEVSTGEAALMELIAETAAEAGLFLDKPEEADAEPQVSRADELQQEWQTATGQLWRLPSRTAGQEHRLICGDCTDAAVVGRVMGGERADMISIDPPYGVGYNRHIPRPKHKNLQNDDYPQPERLLANMPASPALYVWSRWDVLRDWLPVISLPVRNVIVWDKQTNGMGDLSTTYAPSWEACIFASESGHVLRGGRDRDVWQATRPGSEDHLTPKPVELIEKCITKSTDAAAIVADFFSGSGTTIIAAENLARQCRAVEISPAYVAVALQRYQDAFGITPELVE